MVKVSKYLYLKNCKAADIPVLETEERVLSSATDENGHFDPNWFMALMDVAHMPLTRSQKKILKWMPTIDDDPFVASEKNRQVNIMLEKMRKHNKG